MDEGELGKYKDKREVLNMFKMFNPFESING